MRTKSLAWAVAALAAVTLAACSSSGGGTTTPSGSPVAAWCAWRGGATGGVAGGVDPRDEPALVQHGHREVAVHPLVCGRVCLQSMRHPEQPFGARPVPHE